MTGLDQQQVDWLYEQLAAMIEWDSPIGRPRALPLCTALVMVLFALRHNLPPDVLAELFGCGSSTVERYQDELEALIDEMLTPLYEQIRAQARAGTRCWWTVWSSRSANARAPTGCSPTTKATVDKTCKKPPGRELSEARRACNTALNRIRAAVERAIAHLKCWRVLKTGFRRSLQEFPAVLRTVTKLEIFRVYGLH